MKNSDHLDLPMAEVSSGPGLILDIPGMIRIVRERSWLIISCVVVAVLAAGLYIKLAPKVYEAATTVEVEQKDANVVNAEQVVSEDMSGADVLNTVADKLQNPSLLEKVLEANHLLPSEVMGVTNDLQTLGRAKIIQKFVRNVNASLIRNTRLITITVQNSDPRLAARLANSVVENYLAQDALAQQSTTEGANTFLQQEAERQKRKLEAAEQALEDYRKQVGSVSLEENQDIISPRLKELSALLTQTNASVILTRGAYQDSLEMSTNIEDLLAYSRVATDPDVVQITAAVAQHQNDFLLIQQRYRERNPKYRLAEESLRDLEQKQAEIVLKVRSRIQESLRIAYQNALTSQQGLAVELQATETNAWQLSEFAIRYNVLAREVEADKAQFDSIINRLGQTAVAEQIAPERLRVIQPAAMPELPASPKVEVIFIFAILGGLFAGLGIIFVVDGANPSIRTADESEHYLALPVLGEIPRLPKNEIHNCIVTANGNQDSAGLEVFRTLRTTLAMRGRETGGKSYLFTSALPDEGKTFASVNYAASLAQQGRRTLLIDMDLRRPMIEELFTGKRNLLPGVTEYLSGQSKFDDLCVQHPDITNLFWLPGGSHVPNPLELLTQSDFHQLLDGALANFDRVIIDTAPLLLVSDALILAGEVQTVVLVVKGGKTPRKAVQRSVQLLKQADVTIGGILLNLVPLRLGKGHYYSSIYA